MIKLVQSSQKFYTDFEPGTISIIEATHTASYRGVEETSFAVNQTLKQRDNYH